MPALEAQLVITARDQADAAFERLEKQIAALDAQIAVFDRLLGSVGKVAKQMDPLDRTVSEATAALEQQRAALAEVRAGFEGMAGPIDQTALAQARVAAETARATRALAEQGRTAQQIGGQVRREAERMGLRQSLGELAPFAGPELLHQTRESLKAGATLQERIAQLVASGATPAEIAQARDDYQAFSKTHAGVKEEDYLATYRDARVIAPGEESFEMARLGARYRAALRNSGLSGSEYDVGNVLRIMDELGLKDMGQREDFLNNFLKSQQAFGDQIHTETALAAYRNAKQSIYDWSPEFRNKYFPTLLQSAGQQGGTEMMTALNNYIGHHMQKTEIEALVAAGFVRPEDVKTDHGRTTFRDGAKLFEQDVFKSNIAQWAWDFHDAYMKRPGASEDKFGDLIAKMPRNMAGLIAFLVHNEARVKRDALTLDKPVGLGAEGNSFLANNPIAGKDGVLNSIEQLGATLTSPMMKDAGAALAWFSSGIDTLSHSLAGLNKANPKAGEALGLGVTGTMGALGVWLTSKLMFGLGRLFGFGGGAPAGAAAPAAASAGWGSALLRMFGGGAAIASMDAALGQGTANVLARAARLDAGMSSDAAGVIADIRRQERARGINLNPLGLDRFEMDEMRGGMDREAARGRALGALPQHLDVNVSGDAKLESTIRVEAGSELLRIADQVKRLAVDMPLTGRNVGRMDSDAAPSRGIGHQ